MKTLEQLFPNAAARAMADQVVDKLDVALPMHAFLDAWEAEYYRVAKSSPVRPREKQKPSKG